MKLKLQFVEREIAGDFLLIPVGDTSLTANGIIMLNELGRFIWEQLPKAEAREDILKSILAEFDVDEQTAGADLDEFLGRLREIGVID